jgi:Flp pilus assembly CpaF family ATPase
VVGRLFEGEEAVLHVIERIVAPLGRRVDGSLPWVDARLVGTAAGFRPTFLTPLFCPHSVTR